MGQPGTPGRLNHVGGSSTAKLGPTRRSERRRLTGPKAGYYHHVGDLWLEMPQAGVAVRILGVPDRRGSWDVSMLWNQSGYLEGTAFPTRIGNTVLTGHAYLANGARGPFSRLNQLRKGEELVIRGFGYRHVYEVRNIGFVSPKGSSPTAFGHQDWITLLTCKESDKDLDLYVSRMGVQAVLNRVVPD